MGVDGKGSDEHAHTYNDGSIWFSISVFISLAVASRYTTSQE